MEIIYYNILIIVIINNQNNMEREWQLVWDNNLIAHIGVDQIHMCVCVWRGPNKSQVLAFLGGLTFIVSISLVLMTTMSVSFSGSDFWSFSLFFLASPLFPRLFWSTRFTWSDFESLRELKENNKINAWDEYHCTDYPN